MTKEREKKLGKDQQLLEAARLGQYKQLETILQELQQKSKKRSNPLASLRRNIGPNSIRDSVTGFTSLHHAALNGHSQCVQLILDYGAKVNAVDYKGSSALHLAAWAGNLQVVRILIDNCSNKCDQENVGTADQSSGKGSPKAKCSKPSTQPKGGNAGGERIKGSFGRMNDSDRAAAAAASSLASSTSSHSATTTNQFQELDINLRNNDNETPLSLASQFGHNQVVAELLANGANLHLRNNQFESALDLACLNGRLETVRLLLDSSTQLVAELRRPQATKTPTNQFSASGAGAGAGCGSGSGPANGSLPASTNSNMAPNGQQQSTGRRQAGGGGWASLLRGGGASTKSASHQSPSGSQLEAMANQWSPVSAMARRATLADEGDLLTPALSDLRNQWRHQQVSFDGSWQASVGDQVQATIMASTIRDDRHQAALLDHSPLHYAVRRNHLQVIRLLLEHYGANLLQITSLGSVLHELAFSHGGGLGGSRTLTSGLQADSSDTIALIFAHLTQQAAQTGQPITLLLQALLNLKNAQHKVVFEVLDELNTRSAREIKRLICEFSDQLQQSSQRAQTLALGQSESRNDGQANKQASLLATVDSVGGQTRPPLLFNDGKQINSFVTMKRRPKNQPNHLAENPAPGYALHHYNASALNGSTPTEFTKQPQQLQTFPMGTQTIGRRQTMLMNQEQRLNQGRQQMVQTTTTTTTAINPNHGHQAPPNSVDTQPYGTRFSGSVSVQRGPAIPGQAQTATMTRSVSNLMPQHAQDQQQANSNSELSLQWRQWLAQGLIQPEQLVDQNNVSQLQQTGCNSSATQARKRRSKSRDLGSLLMQVQQPHQDHHQQQIDPRNLDHLYDNNYTNNDKQFAQPRSQVNMGQVSSGSHPLVRSQTDCSHLMGRLFGAQSATSSSINDKLVNQMALSDGSNSSLATAGGHIHPSHLRAGLVSSHSQQQHQMLQNHTHQQQHHHIATLDRKAINRHYHVYEHEFYPPRLIDHATIDCGPAKHHNHLKQAVAIVPPLGRQQVPDRPTQGTSQGQMATNEHPESSKVAANIPESEQRQQQLIVGRDAGGASVSSGASSGRLSFNLSDSKGSQTMHPQPFLQQAKQHPSSHHQSFDFHQPQQMQPNSNQIDRFIGRHSARKSAQLATNAPAGASLASSSRKRDPASNSTGPSVDNRSMIQSVGGSSSCNPELVGAGTESGSSTGHMYTSQSLESHLGESHLFEATRQALMRDFDQMVGRELLNREETQGQHQQASILTGVLLDMDQRGERLTVSGTRITLPAPGGAKEPQHVSQDPRPTLDRAQKSNQPSTGATSAKQGPPPKPPKPKLRIPGHQVPSTGGPSGNGCRSNRQQLVGNSSEQSRPLSSSSSTSSSAIYDLPILVPNLSDVPASCTPKQPSRAKPSTLPTAPLQTGTPVVGMHGHQSLQQQRSVSSLTEPPQERPPPPPPPSGTDETVGVACEVMAPTRLGQQVPASSRDCKDSPDSPSSLSDPLRQSEAESSHGDRAPMDANELSQTTSNTLSDSNELHSGVQQVDASSGLREQHHEDTRHPMTTNEGDSGICTSNSPSSMSHDEQRLSSHRNQQTASRSQWDSFKLPPPTPQVAQLCIEEALLPLEMSKTHEMANQTVWSSFERGDPQPPASLPPMPPQNRSFAGRRKRNSMEAVVGWLDSTPTSSSSMSKLAEQPASMQSGVYENCQTLQQKLQGAKCKSVQALFGSLLEPPAGLTRLDPSALLDVRAKDHDSLQLMDASEGSMLSQPCLSSSSSPPSTSSSNQGEYEDDDYAATSSSTAPSNSIELNQVNSDDIGRSARNYNGACGDVHGSKCKEVLLKVVLDEQTSSGDETFYIKSSELRKIASCTESGNQKEVETLTDEELCASVDKDSGLIRFTIRKREPIGQTRGADDEARDGLSAESFHLHHKAPDDKLAMFEAEPTREMDTGDIRRESEGARDATPGDSVRETKLVDLQIVAPKAMTDLPDTRSHDMFGAKPCDAGNIKQESLDSNEADLSHDTTSSSISSGESIRSIVSLKHQLSNDINNNANSTQSEPDVRQQAMKQQTVIGVAINNCEQETSQQPNSRESKTNHCLSAEGKPTADQLDDSQSESNQSKCNKIEEICSSSSSKKVISTKPNVKSSIVSETIRRLEAATAAAKQDTQGLNQVKPVTAVTSNKTQMPPPVKAQPIAAIRRNQRTLHQDVTLDGEQNGADPDTMPRDQQGRQAGQQMCMREPEGAKAASSIANRISRLRALQEVENQTRLSMNRQPPPPKPPKPMLRIGAQGNVLQTIASVAGIATNMKEECEKF